MSLSRSFDESEAQRRINDEANLRIPFEDLEFINHQTEVVNELWFNCWLSDRHGSSWQVLKHNLDNNSFTEAKKIISDAGLFLFKQDISIQDGQETVSWLVLNLHGYTRDEYWSSKQTRRVKKRYSWQL